MPRAEATKLLGPEEAAKRTASDVHVLREGIVCKTDDRGYATPQNRDPARIVVDVREGFVRLWAPRTTLRWRFQEQSMKAFADPEAAKGYIKDLMGEALTGWRDALPVSFNETPDLWDFEVALVPDDCDPNGCVLAAAFFPDGGRHQLTLYPKMFSQRRAEQVETLQHEFGHVFGLRHFFANVSESAWPSAIFGKHSKFSIMNYGELSRLTNNDRADLKRLYQSVWNGDLTAINGTPISLEHPYSALHAPVVPSPVLLLGDGFVAPAPAARRGQRRAYNTGAG
jgi:hypothetical protein